MSFSHPVESKGSAGPGRTRPGTARPSWYGVPAGQGSKEPAGTERGVQNDVAIESDQWDAHLAHVQITGASHSVTAMNPQQIPTPRPYCGQRSHSSPVCQSWETKF